MISGDMIFHNIKNRYKAFGMAILIVPVFILLAFAIGEGLSPEFGMSGFILHFAQALPLLGLLYVVWRWPKVGGWILLVSGLVLAFLYLFFTGGPLGMKFSTLLMLFAPPVVAGWLLVLSVNRNVMKKGG